MRRSELETTDRHFSVLNSQFSQFFSSFHLYMLKRKCQLTLEFPRFVSIFKTLIQKRPKRFSGLR